MLNIIIISSFLPCELETVVKDIRQLVLLGNGREKPTFLVTNDTSSSSAQIVSTYARRWRIENGIAEAVKFFHLNALSSPILIKVHFDILMTVISNMFVMSRNIPGNYRFLNTMMFPRCIDILYGVQQPSR